MGERTSSVEQDGYSRGAPAPSPEDEVRRLTTGVAVLREELGGLVMELDQRRHEMLDVNLQIRRHSMGLGVAAASLLGTATAVVWLMIWQGRRRDRSRSYAPWLTEAVSHPVGAQQRIAVEPSIGARILMTTTTAVIAPMMNKLLMQAMNGLLERSTLVNRADRESSRRHDGPLFRPSRTER